MAEPMVTDEVAKKKSGKRKRSSGLNQISNEERESRIVVLENEKNGLLNYYKECLGEKIGLDDSGNNSEIAWLLEERGVSLSKLVDEVYDKVKEGREGVSLASVKSTVLLIGQRVSYGVPNVDADVLEDEREEALWCWETRDLKLMPKTVRGIIKSRRVCRKKVHERIIAISDMIAALQKSEDNQSYSHDIRKASEVLGKALSESDIRLLQQSLEQKNDANKSEKDAKKEQKELMKQLEKSKREAEREKKKLDRELEKEKKQNEKELRRIQDEAEKEEKRREKEESEMQKHIKKQEEEAEKEQRRREKEEAEKKKLLSMQKQASLMERFLKKSKTSSTSPNNQSSPKTTMSNTLLNRIEPVTQLLDDALFQNESTSAEDLRRSHLSSWRGLGREIRGNAKQHWGIRKTPKIELIKEIKLCTSKGDERIIDLDVDNSPSSSQKHYRYKQLLQFDNSHRPAFYGIWPNTSRVIGPRHPLKMDPDLDYDIDSDEEWEEEEPGESLSDCDKDDIEESLEEGNAKVDDEDESEDGFFVPDGYLSESEGVEVDRKGKDAVMEGAINSPSCKQEFESEEITLLLRQQKQLHSWTEHAMRKNKPIIIVNILHEKSSLLGTEELSGTAKLERTCLQTLSMCPFPGFPSIKIAVPIKSSECENTSISDRKDKTTPVATTKVLMESDLPEIVSIIQVSSPSINKVVTSLQQKFPCVPKIQLRNKVREIAEFMDNRWQVKKEILDKLAISISPEKDGNRGKSIASFFSKRCLPPGNGKALNFAETSPVLSQKPSTAVETKPGDVNTQQQPMVSTQPQHA